MNKKSLTWCGGVSTQCPFPLFLPADRDQETSLDKGTRAPEAMEQQSRTAHLVERGTPELMERRTPDLVERGEVPPNIPPPAIIRRGLRTPDSLDGVNDALLVNEGRCGLICGIPQYTILMC